jgi:hypothetical protein
MIIIWDYYPVILIKVNPDLLGIYWVGKLRIIQCGKIITISNRYQWISKILIVAITIRYTDLSPVVGFDRFFQSIIKHSE